MFNENRRILLTIKSSFIIFCFALLISVPVKAHTISQHIQELYSGAYLPLFILAAILPFVGPGITTGLCHKNLNRSNRNHFFVFIIAAFYVIALFFEVPETVILINRFSIVIMGIYILVSKNFGEKIILILNLALGITLGLEYGNSYAHSDEMKWLYLLIPLSGIVVYYSLVFLFSKVRTMTFAWRLISGSFLTLLGAIVILLT